MKNIKYIACLITLILIGCDNDLDFDDRGFDFQELPNYVAFNPAGTRATFPPIDTDEEEGSEDVSIEIPGGTLSDVTVNYTFGGSAIFGTDFTVDGATSAGGTLVIALTTVPNQDGLPVNGDIVVNLLEDGVIDGDKTLTITIVSASNADGELPIGRGGQDLLRTATVNIADVDE
ncbi:hypothetical protein [Maribacter sp. 2304DJ31-5]|uniref:hypothetical protein n=1 Tax=Maribacter sp. 2304DJ31-5 TaxID=3386273 RepID=UPI0039BCB025